LNAFNTEGLIMHLSIRVLTRYRWLFAAGIVAATLLPGAPARAVPAAGFPQLLVIGRLTDACTNAAIGDGSVRLASVGDPTAVENNGGHFMFTGLPGGQYVLTANAIGYVDGSVRLLLPAVQDQTGAVFHADLALVPTGGCPGG
jgi:hypothetical protein